MRKWERTFSVILKSEAKRIKEGRTRIERENIYSLHYILCAMTSLYLDSILQGLHFILGLYCIVIMLNACLCCLKLKHKSCPPKLTSTKEMVVVVV